MKSLTTEAIAMVLLRPLVTSWPVLRSRTATVISAPASAASAVACTSRLFSPSNVPVGFSGGASGRGAEVPSGATTVRCGAAGGGGGLPYNLASHPEIVAAAPNARAEERRVGKEWVSKCRSRWGRDHK